MALNPTGFGFSAAGILRGGNFSLRIFSAQGAPEVAPKHGAVVMPQTRNGLSPLPGTPELQGQTAAPEGAAKHNAGELAPAPLGYNGQLRMLTSSDSMKFAKQCPDIGRCNMPELAVLTST